MEGLEFSTTIEGWANDILVWVGFGTLVGLLAKAIMPGRDPGGAVATLAMGIGGTIIGCAVLAWFWKDGRVTPISPIGMAVATAGAFVILFFYRLLAGYWFVEGDHPPSYYRRRHYRRGRRRDYAHYDE